jgi:hypothetical protein
VYLLPLEREALLHHLLLYLPISPYISVYLLLLEREALLHDLLFALEQLRPKLDRLVRLAARHRRRRRRRRRRLRRSGGLGRVCRGARAGELVRVRVWLG